MTQESEIRFLRFAGRRVAYAVTGAGPPLVAPAWWFSHLEADWRDPAFRGLWESVAEGYTLVLYDRLGVGMSDRAIRDEDLTLDGDVALLSAVREAIVGTVRSHWGLGSRLLADIFLGDADSAERERLARYQRDAASPETAAVLLELIYRNDVRSELREVRAPTLVVHRRDDRAIPYALGRELAAGIPSATLVPLAGNAHFPWAGDSDSVV